MFGTKSITPMVLFFLIWAILMAQGSTSLFFWCSAKKCVEKIGVNADYNATYEKFAKKRRAETLDGKILTSDQIDKMHLSISRKEQLRQHLQYSECDEIETTEMAEMPHSGKEGPPDEEYELLSLPFDERKTSDGIQFDVQQNIDNYEHGNGAATKMNKIQDEENLMEPQSDPRELKLVIPNNPVKEIQWKLERYVKQNIVSLKNNFGYDKILPALPMTAVSIYGLYYKPEFEFGPFLLGTISTTSLLAMFYILSASILIFIFGIISSAFDRIGRKEQRIHFDGIDIKDLGKCLMLSFLSMSLFFLSLPNVSEFSSIFGMSFAFLAFNLAQQFYSKI